MGMLEGRILMALLDLLMWRKDSVDRSVVASISELSFSLRISRLSSWWLSLNESLWMYLRPEQSWLWEGQGLKNISFVQATELYFPLSSQIKEESWIDATDISIEGSFSRLMQKVSLITSSTGRSLNDYFRFLSARIKGGFPHGFLTKSRFFWAEQSACRGNLGDRLRVGFWTGSESSCELIAGIEFMIYICN